MANFSITTSKTWTHKWEPWFIGYMRTHSTKRYWVWILADEYLSHFYSKTVSKNENTKMNEKRPGMPHFYKTWKRDASYWGDPLTTALTHCIFLIVARINVSHRFELLFLWVTNALKLVFYHPPKAYFSIVRLSTNSLEIYAWNNTTNSTQWWQYNITTTTTTAAYNVTTTTIEGCTYISQVGRYFNWRVGL